MLEIHFLCVNILARLISACDMQGGHLCISERTHTLVIFPAGLQAIHQCEGVGALCTPSPISLDDFNPEEDK